jgi:hypothetical protein
LLRWGDPIAERAKKSPRRTNRAGWNFANNREERLLKQTMPQSPPRRERRFCMAAMHKEEACAEIAKRSATLHRRSTTAPHPSLSGDRMSFLDPFIARSSPGGNRP